MGLTASLASLAASAFISATLFPGASEAVLTAVLANFREAWPAALLTAAAANTLGAMTTYAIGRLIPQKKLPQKALTRLQHYGSPLLILSWLPVVGDALSLAAGWLKLNVWAALFWTALGKFLRYGGITLIFFGVWPQ